MCNRHFCTKSPQEPTMTPIPGNDTVEGMETNGFELVEPFQTENGEMNGIEAELAFALGVEWALFRERLKNGRPFIDFILAPNAARLGDMAQRHGRFAECHPVDHQWSKIIVGGHFV